MKEKRKLKHRNKLMKIVLILQNNNNYNNKNL